MLKLIISAASTIPFIVVSITRYSTNMTIFIFFLLLFIVGAPTFVYLLSAYIVDKGIKVPNYTTHDEIIRIRSSLEDKWRNK